MATNPAIYIGAAFFAVIVIYFLFMRKKSSPATPNATTSTPSPSTNTPAPTTLQQAVAGSYSRIGTTGPAGPWNIQYDPTNQLWVVADTGVTPASQTGDFVYAWNNDGSAALAGFYYDQHTSTENIIQIEDYHGGLKIIAANAVSNFVTVPTSISSGYTLNPGTYNLSSTNSNMKSSTITISPDGNTVTITLTGTSGTGTPAPSSTGPYSFINQQQDVIATVKSFNFNTVTFVSSWGATQDTFTGAYIFFFYGSFAPQLLSEGNPRLIMYLYVKSGQATLNFLEDDIAGNNIWNWNKTST